MAPLYHWYVGAPPPFVGVAVKVTLVPAQMVLPGAAAIVTLTGKFGFTVMVIVFDVAGLPVAQVALEVSCTLIASPFTNVDDTYVTAVSPLIGVTPLYHWYVGAPPPLVGVAVKVTSVPAHIVLPGAAAIVTLTGKFGFTVIVIVFDVAVVEVMQVPPVTVISQVTWSVLASVVVA